MRVCVRVFSVGFGPGLDSMSPARSRRSASHVAGTHGWLPQKTGRGRWIQFAQCSPDCGTPTTSRLYPFGAPSTLHTFLHPGLVTFPHHMSTPSQSTTSNDSCDRLNFHQLSQFFSCLS